MINMILNVRFQTRSSFKMESLQEANDGTKYLQTIFVPVGNAWAAGVEWVCDSCQLFNNDYKGAPQCVNKDQQKKITFTLHNPQIEIGKTSIHNFLELWLWI